MSLRMRNLLYALGLLAVMAFAAVAAAGPKDKAHHADVEATWPAPIVAGGAMPVQWTNIVAPTATDWFGLFAPEGADNSAVEWLYVSCSQTPVVGRQTGICGFVIPSSVPPGTYEIRLYSGAGAKIGTSQKFDVLEGGLR